ncbi:MAG TPA: hypothetical protein VH560_11380 [Polyangia bacterium]|jgi:hypothetical protein|nr:hypothetical protein [Polyangia bacterium]
MKLGLTVAIGAVMALSSVAARAERPRIAVMEILGGKVTPDLRERVTHAVDEGLLASGADVVDGMPAAATGPGGAPCDGNGCVQSVAKATVAAYVLRGTLEIDGRTYELRLEMLDGKTGVLIDSREDRCEICTESEALEMAGVSASALKVQVFKKSAPVRATDTSVVAAPAPSATPPGAVRIEASAPASEPSPSGHRQLGWIGVAAGVVAVAAGISLISIDGNPTCGASSGVQCPELRSTKGGGIAAIVGGAALVGLGALVLTGTF